MVLLPQGQFRRLLLAGSKEREDILEVLFQTETYRRIELALKEAAKGIETAVQDLRKRQLSSSWNRPSWPLERISIRNACS